MLARTFVDRPVFAWVLAILVMLLGAGALRSLPVEQYPDIAPPTINIRASYNGASAEILAQSVTQIIEQQLTGLEGLLYFQSTAESNGLLSIAVTFDKGIDPDIAQVQVQNRVQQALPRLPQEVQQQGLRVTQANSDLLMVVSVYDRTDRLTSVDVSDFLISNLQDTLARLPGVGDVNVFGAQYALRIWLDPFRLARVQLTPGDVIAAVRAQNTQVAAGQIGDLPSPPGQMLNAIVTARSRLTTPDEFRRIVVKTRSDGGVVRVEDVARVELGSESYSTISRLNGHPASGIGIQLAPGGDALKTAELVRSTVDQAARTFPQGLAVAYPSDSTAFIRLSIDEVVETLIVAIILVVLVMFLFLQSWRATLIPAIAVPVVLLGTFGVLAVFGYSVNTLTLFGLVLSIGLLVDDAIVVVENVERVLEEEPGISVRDAVLKSMAEINVALIAIALVLSAVFLPMAFFGGSVGVIYRQFSITIVASMVLSVFVALILSPALAATLLKRRDPHEEPTGPAAIRWIGRRGRGFNRWYERSADRYRAAVAWLIRRPAPALFVFTGLAAALVLLFLRLPTGFLPTEDQGRSFIQFSLPSGATQERTLAVAEEVERYFAQEESDLVRVIYTIIGQNSAGVGQNAGRGFISFSHWDERTEPGEAALDVTRRATRALSQLRDAEFFAFNPPPVRSLGQSTGFTLQLLNSSNLPQAEFAARRDQLLAAARADPSLAQVRGNTLEDVPTLSIGIDDAKTGALGVDQAAVDQTIGAGWGGVYVNDFIDRGRVKRVFVQGDAPYRSRPEDLANWFVRGEAGQMAPLSAVATTRWARTPNTITRFNGLPAFEISGQAAAGGSSGDAMATIAALADALPGVSYAWSGLSYQEQASGGQAPLLYALSIAVVFLCLAALYESWSIPLAVLLTIPIGLLGATLAVTLRGLENDVYFQVGLLTTIGLSARNAILIVEFAEQAEKAGKTAVDAALEASRRRLRPIVMTSLAFMLGVLPLAIASGAGAASRIAIGTAVLGGMVTATVIAIFFVPLFYVLVRRWLGRRRPAAVAEVVRAEPARLPRAAYREAAE